MTYPSPRAIWHSQQEPINPKSELICLVSALIQNINIQCSTNYNSENIYVLFLAQTVAQEVRIFVRSFIRSFVRPMKVCLKSIVCLRHVHFTLAMGTADTRARLELKKNEWTRLRPPGPTASLRRTRPRVWWSRLSARPRAPSWSSCNTMYESRAFKKHEKWSNRHFETFNLLLYVCKTG